MVIKILQTSWRPISHILPSVRESLGELLYGARASQRQDENLAKIYQFLHIVQVVEFNQASAEQYSHIRVSLRHKGRPTSEVDALIAAIAIAHNAILVTDNVKHFQHIEVLTVENWLQTQELKKGEDEKKSEHSNRKKSQVNKKPT